MQYLKLKSGSTIIELHNNWLGEETVIIGGKIVSKKSSVTGINHHFSIHENGEKVNYVLTTKILDNMMSVGVDLSRNGTLIYENVKLPYGSKPKSPGQELKSKALSKLKQYDIPEAILLLDHAKDLDPDDAEIYFHLACAYSNLEDSENGYANIKKAVECGLADHESILNHDMLAYLRIQDQFEKFQQSGFKSYKLSKKKK
ncbi:MAG: hypothetical protein IPK35_19355 [Saprospiraceae bacterium]|nr:hypothetical protein [Saprospiraceae bacterium]